MITNQDKLSADQEAERQYWEQVEQGNDWIARWQRVLRRNSRCAHNEMIQTGDPKHAWKCAKCGYIYGLATAIDKAEGSAL